MNMQEAILRFFGSSDMMLAVNLTNQILRGEAAAVKLVSESLGRSCISARGKIRLHTVMSQN